MEHIVIRQEQMGARFLVNDGWHDSKMHGILVSGFATACIA